MAWNEPGGNNNDPWKNKGGRDQGPPDLDEVLKKLFGKFKAPGGGKSGGSGKSFGGLGAGIIVGILVVVWFFSGFYTIKEAERGVVLRFGEFHEFVEPGLQWKPTFVDSVIPINVQQIFSISAQGSMLTQDENLVDVNMEVQYRIIEPRKYVFSVTDPQGSLSQAFNSAIRYVVGHSNMDSILTDGREVARQQVWDELRGIVTPYDMGVDIVDVNIKDARPPEAVKQAFDDAIAAQEDEERYIREAEAYAREREPSARGEVNRMSEEANAYKQRVTLEAQGEVARFAALLPQYVAAPEVTRQRIYLETLEEVYSNTSKVMLDSQGSGNMMYLPLDKIMQQQGTLPAQRNPRNSFNTPRRVDNNDSSPTQLRGDRTRSGRN